MYARNTPGPGEEREEDSKARRGKESNGRKRATGKNEAENKIKGCPTKNSETQDSDECEKTNSRKISVKLSYIIAAAVVCM